MAQLTLAAAGQVQAVGTDGINEYLEMPGTAQLEVMRVTSTNDGDYVYSQRFQTIKSVKATNHGSAIGTGRRADPPKITITQGSATANAKITINHTNSSQEVFSLFIWGDM